MAKIPQLTSQTETYPGRQPDILQHRASVVSDGIHRILQAVPVVEETQVLSSAMTDEQKRERLRNTVPLDINDAPMPQDVYIAALASDSAPQTETSINEPNADLLGTAQAAIRDIFGLGSDE